MEHDTLWIADHICNQVAEQIIIVADSTCAIRPRLGRGLRYASVALSCEASVTLDQRRRIWHSRTPDDIIASTSNIDVDVDVELAELLPPSAHTWAESASPHLQPTPPAAFRRRQKLCQLLERDMKFSHSLQFNAVPDWSSNYISYSNLKKLIFQLEKQVNQLGQPASSALDPESSPLLTNGSAIDDPDKVFSRKLDDELEKICSFYRMKELEIYGEVEALLQDVQDFDNEHATGEDAGEDGQRRNSLWHRARQQSIFRAGHYHGRRRKSSATGSNRGDTIPEEADESEDDDNEQTALTKSQSTLDKRAGRVKDLATADHGSAADWSTPDLRRRPSGAFADFGDDALQALYDEGITLKKRIVNLYTSICELRSFIQLNETGFSKVLKKYDKIMDRTLKSSWIKSNVKPAYPFQESTMDHLSDNLTKVEEAYASIVTKGDVEAARRELRLHLREHVVWERNTVWREMIGIERKAQAANLGIRNTMLGANGDPRKGRLQGDEEEGALKEVNLPIGKYRCPKFLVTSTFWVLCLIIAIFAVLLVVPIMEKPEQQNCLALVVFVSLLWATEVGCDGG